MEEMDAAREYGEELLKIVDDFKAKIKAVGYKGP